MARINMNALTALVEKDRTSILSTRYEAWLARTKGDEPYPPWVVDKITPHLLTRPRRREGTFGGSEAGKCLRQQELSYIGMADISRHLQTEYTKMVEPGLVNIFNDGKWRHLRWQANLLTAGIVTDIEYPANWPAMRSKNTVDAVGIVPDDHLNPDWRGAFFGVELKGLNSWPYKKYTEANDQMAKHKGQFNRYFAVGGFDLFVVLYECKDTNEYHEWVFEPDSVEMAEAEQELYDLNLAVDNQILDDPLPSCLARMGNAWKNCPFSGRGGICERMDRWP